MRRFMMAIGWILIAVSARADDPEAPVMGNLMRFSLTPAGAGARAAGMANSFTALADDGTAASWNPAGLAQLEKPEASVVFSASGQSIENDAAQARSGPGVYSPYRMSYNRGSFDFASMAFPFALGGKPVTLQVSWQRAYRLWFHSPATIMESLPSGPGALIHSRTDLDGSIGFFSLAGGVRLTERALVGASLNFWSGDWSMGTSILDTPAGVPPPNSQILSFRQWNHISGTNYNIGILLLYPKASVGLVYRSAFHANYHFNTRLASNLPNGGQTSSDYATTLRFPRQISAGVAWKPTDTWTLALDLTQIQWSRMEIQGVTGAFPPLNFLDFLPASTTTTRDTLAFNAGAEYLWLRPKAVIPLRFGLAYDPQGGRDPWRGDPVNYYVLALGTGYNTNAWKLDAAVQYRWANFHSSSYIEPASIAQTPRTPDAYGPVHTAEWRVSFSVIYRMNESSGMNRFFHKAFVGP